MIKQMFKLVWNRKRTNVLIIAEIFFSFVVLFAVLAYAVDYANNYQEPLGFSHENVWTISLSSIFDVYNEDLKQEIGEELRRMMLALKDVNEVEAVAGIGMTPFQLGMSNRHMAYAGRVELVLFNDATDDLKDVMGLQVVHGRWFEPSDEALSYEPVVINQRLRDRLFGNEDPLGKAFDRPKDSSKDATRKESRVVGVITDFRQHGEFHSLYNYAFRRKSLQTPLGEGMISIPMSLVVKLRPGTPASFEEKLMTAVRSISRDRTIQIEPLSRARRSHMRLVLAPIIAALLVAVFLIIMVGLGMVGVLWQNVSRRTKEIGLRRALGGTAADIYGQVLGELLVVASIGLLLGTALVAQVPLLEMTDWMTPGIFATALAFSLLVMYTLTIGAALYPSWLATRVRPAGALHYE